MVVSLAKASENKTMNYIISIGAGIAVLFTITAIASTQNKSTTQNVLVKKWTGPYGGVPPFHQVKVSQFKPALEIAMAEMRKEIEKIANNPNPATFENTLDALENAGQTFSRVSAVYGVWGSSLSSPQFQAIEQEMAPKLSAFFDEIVQNTKLFNRIDAVYHADQSKLTAEQKRLSWYHYTRFKLQGAQLDAEKKKKISEINQRLATLTTKFGQNVMADEANDCLVIEKQSDLAGLSPELIAAAGADAEKRKMKGKWTIANTRSSMEPFLTFSTRRDLREKAFKIWSARGDQKNANDNNEVVSQILKLRTDYAKVLGHKTYAHWHLADTMAKDPQAAMDLMLKVWKPAVAQAKKDIIEMQAIVDAEKGGFKIEAWDYRFYSEKVRKAKFDFDFGAVKPYLQLEKIRDAMFASARQQYGLNFKKIEGIPTFHKSMSVYEVSRNEKVVGLWYFDPYAREGKRSGAWMSAFREQNKMNGQSINTLVSNNSNFVQTKAGTPVLISWDDANTMFHEFGHALHGLNSDVVYPSLSGTNTTRDYVEFPSQFNENFLKTTEVLKFLTNSAGKALPAELIKKMDEAKNFGEGFRSVEFLASAIVDMKLHLETGIVNPRNFEKETLKELGMPSEIIMRHRITQFNHLFSGDSYAAGYYGYLWADVLNHDAFEGFNADTSKKFLKSILSVGNTVDPAEAYRSFKGRDPHPDALLKARGFN